MSEKGSVFQTGGGGTNFEQYVQCAFFTTLIIKGNVPFQSLRHIKLICVLLVIFLIIRNI